jgi:CRISPR-associated exonuclease Cas4
MAEAVLRTLALPEVSAARPKLKPELALYAELGPQHLLAGRADAIAFENEGADIVFDWKSDVSPSAAVIEDHANQLGAYLKATGAKRGALVYMTTGLIRWASAGS